MFKSKHNVSNVLVEIKCEYILSVKVPFFEGVQQHGFINDQLMGLENTKNGLRVKLAITTLGVKIYRKKIVRLGHSTAHILFSSCLLSKNLFAYITKSYSADQIIIYQAHVFKVRRSNDLKLLSVHLKRCFQANSFLLRTISFEECDHFAYKQRTFKTWSKAEHYKGHDALDYVRRIKDIPFVPEKELVEIVKIVKKDESWLKEYDIIELDELFCVEDEYYCSESLVKYKPLEFEIEDEYLSQQDISEIKVETEQPSWLLPKETSPEVIEKNLLLSAIGSYFVTQHQTRENQFVLYLKVPKHIQPLGLLRCLVLYKNNNKYNIQGFSDNFDTLQALVNHYGSIHNGKLIDGKDHTDSSSSINSGVALFSSLSSLSEEEFMLIDYCDDNEDYEVFESAQSLFDEVQEFQTIFDYNEACTQHF